MDSRYHPMSPSFFQRNRRALMAQMRASSFAVFHSNDLMPRNGDCYFPFRQNSDFFYLTGINQEESVLLLFPEAMGEEDKEVLFIMETSEHLKIWEGEKLSVSEAKKISGIRNVQLLDEFEDFVKAVAQKTKLFYFNENANERFQSAVQSRDERLQKSIEQNLNGHKSLSIVKELASLRMIKSQEEIEVIQRACDITGKAFSRVLDYVKPGVHEFEIEAEISHEFTMNRASAHAYLPIVASGKNSCVLHYINNNRLCQDGDVVLLDFGAEYGHYASDLSRTIPVSGKFTKRQKKVYDACYEVFLVAKKEMKPGKSFKEIQRAVVQEMEKQLVDLALFSVSDLKKQDPDNPLYRKYFMHGTSHFMGMDVHDVGDRNQELKEGMVLTCEPGIYIEKEGIGVRIENDILITKDANFDLMANIPIESNHIEELMNK